MKPRAGLMVVLLAVLCAPHARAEQVRAAVAANFSAVFDELAANFAQTSGHTVVSSPGSSGKLYAQIVNGAPFQIFLSADAARVRQLEAEGRAVPGSRFTYAIGRLVLWSARADYVDARGAVLARGGYVRLALANPRTAPYGLAARQVLERLGLWRSLREQKKLVMGENVAQTLHFIDTGNAPLGFVALSQVQGLSGSSWQPPQEYYDPLIQQAVLLRKGADSAAAKAFLDYLRGAEAKAIIARHGYGVG